MTQKTNQFNLTTRRYTEADISAIVDGGGMAFCLSVADRFGDNGITGLALARINGDSAEIDTLLLSCRILGRDIEYAFVRYILEYLRNKGIRQVTARYIPTPKNSQVETFYDKLGFTCTETADDNTKTYGINLDESPCAPDDRYDITSTL